MDLDGGGMNAALPYGVKRDLARSNRWKKMLHFDRFKVGDLVRWHDCLDKREFGLVLRLFSDHGRIRIFWSRLKFDGSREHLAVWEMAYNLRLVEDERHQGW